MKSSFFILIPFFSNILRNEYFNYDIYLTFKFIFFAKHKKTYEKKNMRILMKVRILVSIRINWKSVIIWESFRRKLTFNNVFFKKSKIK